MDASVASDEATCSAARRIQKMWKSKKNNINNIFRIVQIFKNKANIPADHMLHALSKYLAGRVRQWYEKNPLLLVAPTTVPINCALLFVDVSGFTRLSEFFGKMGSKGTEKFSTTMNMFFSAILKIIINHGGDVDCFAGDALLCVFRDPSLAKRGLEEFELTIEEARTARINACQLAVHCGLELHEKSSPWKVTEDIQMTLHSAVGVGETLHIDIGGGLSRRRHAFLTGDALSQIRVAHGYAGSGDLVASPEVWEMVKDKCQGTSAESGCMYIQSIQTPACLLNGKVEPVGAFYTVQMVGNFQQYLPNAAFTRLAAGQGRWMGEHRHVTVVFANLTIPGLSDMRPDPPREAIETLNDIVVSAQDTIFNFDGCIRQLAMDDKGLVLIFAFGVPGQSHTDDAMRAVRTALKLERNANKNQAGVSIGIASGRVYCGTVGSSELRCEYALIGDTVNLAARLAGKAKGSILCDAATENSCKNAAALHYGSTVLFDGLEPIMVKGKTNPIEVFHPRRTSAGWQILREFKTNKVSSIVSALLEARSQDFTVRKVEVERIKQFLAEKEHSESSGIVMVEGSAGVGKDRVVTAVCMSDGLGYILRVRGQQPPAMWRTYSCLGPAIRQVANEIIGDYRMNVHPSLSSSSSSNGASLVTPTTKARRLSLIPASKLRALTTGGSNMYEERAILMKEIPDHLKDKAELLGVVLPCFAGESTLEFQETATPQEISDCTKELVMVLFDVMMAKLQKKDPPSMLLVIDDFHYIDEASLALLEALHHRYSRMHFLLTARPPTENESGGSDWHKSPILRSPRCESVTLGTLTNDQVNDMAKNVLHVQEVPVPVLNYLCAASGGNPLYVQQVLQTLLQGEVIVVKEIDKKNKKCEMNRDIQSLELPETVQGFVTSQLDMLSPQLSLVVKVASVLGMTFELDLLSKLFPVEKQRSRLPMYLDRLVSLGFFIKEEIPGSKTPRWRFTSSVTQNVAYDLLLHSYRRMLHREVASTIESLHYNELGKFYAQLSHHWAAASGVQKNEVEKINTDDPDVEVCLQKAMFYADLNGQEALQLNLKKQLEESQKLNAQLSGVLSRIKSSTNVFDVISPKNATKPLSPSPDQLRVLQQKQVTTSVSTTPKQPSLSATTKKPSFIAAANMPISEEDLGNFTLDAQKFIQMLKDVGFKGDLSPDALEWAFHESSARGCLRWLTQNLNSENVVSKQERERYEELGKEGKILDGDALKEAVKTTILFKDKVSEQGIQSHIDKTEADIRQLKEEISKLTHQREKLTQSYTLLDQRRTRIQSQNYTLQKQCGDLVSLLMTRNTQNSAQIDKVMAAVGKLEEIHNMVGSGPYLSQQDISKFTQNNVDFLEELKRFTLKQFESSTTISNENENEDGNRTQANTTSLWLQLSDPSELVIRGEDAQSYAHLSQEFLRLQSLFAVTEQQRFIALSRQAVVKSMIELAKKQLTLRQTKPPNDDVSSLKRKLGEIQQQRVNAQQDYNLWYSTNVAPLLEDLGKLQGTAVLRGDYDLKLSRQRYVMNRQEQIIGFLVQQHARIQVFDMLLEAEINLHKNLRALLQSLNNEIVRLGQSSHSRVQKMKEIISDANLGSSLHHPYMTRLQKILRNQPPPMTTIETLIEDANRLHDREKKVAAALVSSDLEMDRHHQKLQQQYESAHNILFLETATLQPLLYSLKFRTVMDETSKLCESMSSQLAEIIQKRREKSIQMSMNVEDSALERNLFVDFFLRPNVAAKTIQDLKQRVEAKEIK